MHSAVARDIMGSGKRLKIAIKKYGIENFTKEILYIFDNEVDMRNKEKELVVISEMSYNLCDGGKGGFGYINRSGKALRTGMKHSEESKKKMGHPGKPSPAKVSCGVKNKKIDFQRLCLTH